MDYQDLKAEYRLEHDHGDRWGSVMGAWFDVASLLHNRGANIPADWCYRPGACDPQEVSSWHEHWDCANDYDLTKFGNLLARYAGALRAAGQAHRRRAGHPRSAVPGHDLTRAVARGRSP